MANRENVDNCKESDSTVLEKPDDDEKKSRRSSILKPQKPRNPLGDLDLGNEETQDGDTGTLSRTTTSRRVSFAPSNFVKKFAQDPEKNTIWDSTYEESIEKSSEHSPCIPDRIVSEMSVVQEDDMDITLGKENAQILCSPNMLNLMNISESKRNLVNKTICCNSSIVTDTELVDNGLVYDRNIPDAHSEDAQMEFTEVLPVLCQNNVNNEDVAMEFTGILRKNNASMSTGNRTMYFNTTIKNDSNLMESPTSDTKNAIIVNDSMEFTQALNLINSNETLNQNCLTSENNCAANIANKENCTEMDISENISAQIIISNTENLKITDVIKPAGISNDEHVGIVTKESSEQITLTANRFCKSATQTPVSSFHASLGEFPSCDDTQHLINYNLSSKNQPKSDFSKIIANEYDPTFLNSKYLPLDINSESFRVSLNTVDSSSKHADVEETEGAAGGKERLPENNLSVNAKSKTSGASVIDLITWNSITERIELEESEANISHTIVDLASPYSEKGKDSSADSFTTWFQEELVAPTLHKENYEDAVETIKKNLAYKKRVRRTIEKKFEEFQAQLIKRNRENKEDSWESDSSSTDISINVEQCTKRLSYLNFLPDKEPDEVLPLKEKVKQLCRRCDSYWNITSLEDGVYKFSALCETVKITVKVNEENGEVLHAEIEEDTIKQYEPIILYLRKIFVDRLSSSSLCSGLGERFDVLSFLDYLEITIQKVANMRNDFDKLVETYAVAVDSDFSLRFTVVSIKLEQIWEFRFNMYDLNNICDSSVSVNVKMGHLSRSSIRKCLKGCPKGFDFIGVFIQNVYSMVQCLEQKI